MLRKIGIMITIMLFLTLLGSMQPYCMSEHLELLDSRPECIQHNYHTPLAYTTSGPILIQSDADFETQGWPGEGTYEEPYLIFDLAIASSGYAIHIENTRAHFEIVDCNLTQTTTGDAVFLRNVTNGKIDTTKFGGGYYAVRLLNTSNCVISKCEVSPTVQYGITISQTSKTSLEDCTIIGASGAGTALNLDASQDCAVFNNVVTNKAYGFRINNLVSCSFSHNTLTDLADNGIEGTSISGAFSDNTVSGAQIGLLISGEDNLIAGNNLYQNQNGMQINSKDTIVVGNEVWDSSGTGIVIASSAGNITVQSNRVSATDGDGFYITSTNVQVLDNIVEGDRSIGTTAYSVVKSDVTFVNNTCHGMWYGFHLGDGVQNCQMIRNHISDTRFSFYLRDDLYCSLIDNDITGGYEGIIVDTYIYCSEILIMGNTFNGTEIGIGITDTHNVNITQNEFYDILQTGVYMLSAHGSYIVNNSVFGAGIAGFLIDEDWGTQILDNRLIDASILLISSGGAVLENNDMTSGGLYISGESESDWIVSLSNNLVNGQQIGYMRDIVDLDVDLSGYGQCFILSASNSTFYNGNFTSIHTGISLAFSDNCSIQSCRVAEGKLGIFLCNVTDINVEDIRCTGMTGLWDWYGQVYTGTGVMILNSERCRIAGVTCEYGEDIGASMLNSRLCRFDSCEFIRNNWGVYIESDNCTIVDCLIRLNNVGVKIPNSYSIGNRIYYNRFELNNQTNAIDDARPDPQNIWDDGVSMGNF